MFGRHGDDHMKCICHQNKKERKTRICDQNGRNVEACIYY